MNTKTMGQFNVLNADTLAVVEGGTVPYGWYSPFSVISDNIICKNGYAYSQANFQAGHCRANWASVVNGVIGEITVAIGTGFGRRP